jgi:hypothetical protein
MTDKIKPYLFHPTKPKPVTGERMDVEEPDASEDGAAAAAVVAAAAERDRRLQSMDWCTCGCCTNLNSTKDN